MDVSRSNNAVTVTGKAGMVSYVVRKDYRSKVCYLHAMWPAVAGSQMVSWAAREYTFRPGAQAADEIAAELEGSYPGVRGFATVAEAVVLARSTR